MIILDFIGPVEYVFRFPNGKRRGKIPYIIYSHGYNEIAL